MPDHYMFGSRSGVFQQIELLKCGFTGNAGMGEDWHIGRNMCAANGAETVSPLASLGN